MSAPPGSRQVSRFVQIGKSDGNQSRRVHQGEKEKDRIPSTNAIFSPFGSWSIRVLSFLFPRFLLFPQSHAEKNSSLRP